MKITREGNLTVQALVENSSMELFYPSATFTRSSSATKSDGTSVASGLPRYEDGKFGKGILIEEGTTNLVLNSDFEVLNPTKQRVFFDDFNRTPTLTFTRTSTNSSKTKTSDFSGKVSGSLVENPNIAKQGGSATFNAPSTFTSEANATHYSQLSVQDGTLFTPTTTTNGIYAQALFSFDVLTTLKRANLIPQSWDVATLKTNLTSITATWVGYGVGSNAGVSTNGATTKVWQVNTSAWTSLGTPNTTSSPSTITAGVLVTNFVDANGIINILAHSTYPSNGTIASTIYTDYVKLDVTVTSPDFAVNPETGSVVQPGVERYVNGRFQNLVPQSSADLELGTFDQWATASGLGDTNWSISTTDKWQGTYSAKHSGTNAVHTWRGKELVISAGNLIGRNMMFSAWAKQTVIGTYPATITVYYSTDGTTYNSATKTSGTSTSTATTWTRLSYLFAVPANTQKLKLEFYTSDANPVGCDTYIDAFQLEEVVSGQTAPTDWRVGGSGKGVLVEEGTTNLLTANQSSVEIDISQWVSDTGVTIVKSSSESWSGTSSIKVTTDGSGTLRGAYISQANTPTCLASTTYTWSVYLKGTGSVKLIPRTYDSGQVTLGGDTEGITVALNNQWQRVTVTRTTEVNAARVGFVLRRPNAESGDFYADAMQIEQKAYATSWVLGGTTRNSETLTVPTTGMSPTAGTWEQWVYVNSNIKRQYNPTIDKGVNVFHIPGSVSATAIGLYHYTDTTNWRLLVRDDAGNPTYISYANSNTPDGWHLFSVTWNSSTKTAKLYVDGVYKTQVVSVGWPSGFGTNVTIGSDLSSASMLHSNAYHDAIRVSNVERTSTEVLAYFNATNPVTLLDDKTVFLLNFDNDLDAEMTTQVGWSDLRSFGVHAFRIKGSKLYTGKNQGNYWNDAQLCHGDVEWTDVDTSLKVSIKSAYATSCGAGISIRSNGDKNNHLSIVIQSSGATGQVSVWKRVAGVISTVTSVNQTIVVGTEYTLRVTITGTAGVVYLNGTQVLTFTVPSDVPTQGKICAYSYIAEATFDDIEVKADVPDKWGSYYYAAVAGNFASYSSVTKRNGNRCAKFTSSNNKASGAYQDISVTSGQQYTASAWVKGTGYLYFRDVTNAITYYASSLFNYPDWTRVSYTTTAPVGCNTLRTYFDVKQVSGSVLYIDSVQVEQKSYATSYHRNDSLTVSSTRNTESLQIPSNTLNLTEGTIELWFKPDTGFFNGSFNPVITHAATTENYNEIGIFRFGGLNKIVAVVSNNSGVYPTGYWWSVQSTTNLSAGNWYHVAMVWSLSRGEYALYVNGVKEDSEAITSASQMPSAFGTLLLGGHVYYTTRYSDSTFDSVRISNIARTDADILASYNRGKSFVSDQYTTANYRFDSNLQSHTDIPMVIKNVSGVETLYLRGSVVQSYSGPLLSATDVKAVLMPEGTFYIRGTKNIG